ncbi:MAG TPA: HAD family hydrolase [Solirubrobacteraceae bacterium]|nr:HAD family hydrolase [Solirubrobacteraceae bacterium]
MVRAVLLDAMGTLVELEHPAPRLREQLRDRAGIDMSEAEAQAALVEEIAYYRLHHCEGHDQASLWQLRRACAEALRAALPPAGRDLPVATVRNALLGALSFRPYPEVPTTLQRLRAAGVRRVVVSNWDVSLHAVLRRTGLARLVSGTITSAELGASKPSPALFRHALTIAGVPARDAVMVGNSVDEDVEGGRASGVAPVLLVRDGAAVPEGLDGVPVIRSLSELPALVA